MAMHTTAEQLEIVGAAGIREVAENHRRLLGVLQSANAVVLDVTQASDVDVAFIQLIEAGRRYAAAHAKTFTLSAPATGELLVQLERGGFVGSGENRAFWLSTAGGGQ